MKTGAWRWEDVRIVPHDYLGPLPLEACFPNRAPLEVDVGCGDGTFLVRQAARHPERNFLGIERLVGRVNLVGQGVVCERLTNVRTLCLESAYAVRYLLPGESVSVFHVLFPDPWPKQRHQRRRLVNEAFVNAMIRALVPEGELRLATDDPDYHEQMLQILEIFSGQLAVRDWPDDPDYPRTRFEEHFLAQGRAIHRLRRVKVF